MPSGPTTAPSLSAPSTWYILRLRQKIETTDGRSLLRGVRGFGHSFDNQVAV
jgi:DNA-binding response OmpR family regulator